MPDIQQHKDKYLENKNILDNLFNPNIDSHRNWYTTITFYAALHIIDMQFADLGKNNLSSHIKRQDEMQKSEAFSAKICIMYKFLSDYSRVARYDAGIVTPTIANQCKIYLQKIELEYLKQDEMGNLKLNSHK